jgi:hypothetical protein
VPDLAFYNAGCDGPRGARWLLVLARRLLRRLLRPIFLRQVELLQSLIDRLDRGEMSVRTVQDDVDRIAQRMDDVDERLETVLAFGWDYVAMVRRLAVLEDQVAVLTGHTAALPDEPDSPSSFLFPSLDPVPQSRAGAWSH